MTTKERRRKAKPEEAEESVPVNADERADDRPQHLADAVLDSYFAQMRLSIGGVYEGGTIMRGAATCINGTEKDSRWRVQCFSRYDGKHGDVFLPKPTACVLVDDSGQIIQTCKS